MTQPACNRGFTLLELVVVMAIFGLVAVMAYGGLNNVLKARAAIEENHESVAELQRLYLRLREDFQQLQPRTVRDEFGDSESAVLGRRDEGVELVRAGWRNPTGRSRSQLQRVRWFIDEGALVRGHYPHLDRAPQAEAQRLTVLEEVDDLRLRYLDGNREWQPEWPPGLRGDPDARAETAPPLAVEVTLETRRWGDLVFLFPSGSQIAAGAVAAGSSGGADGSGGPGVGPGVGPGIGRIGSGFGSGVRTGP